MKNIQIRNVPDPVCDALKRRAAEEGRSLQEYLLAHVRDLASRPSIREVMRRAGEHRGAHVSFEEAAELVRSDRDSR